MPQELWVGGSIKSEISLLRATLFFASSCHIVLTQVCGLHVTILLLIFLPYFPLPLFGHYPFQIFEDWLELFLRMAVSGKESPGTLTCRCNFISLRTYFVFNDNSFVIWNYVLIIYNSLVGLFCGVSWRISIFNIIAQIRQRTMIMVHLCYFFLSLPLPPRPGLQIC